VRFSRHAKNKMRLHQIPPADVDAVIAFPAKADVDQDGNPRLGGLDSQRRAIIVVIAADDPGFVITTFPDD